MIEVGNRIRELHTRSGCAYNLSLCLMKFHVLRLQFQKT